MILLTITPGATTSGTAVGLTQAISTNNNIKLSNNVIQLQAPGIYEITGLANLTATATSGSFGLGIYANGTAVGVSTYGTSSAASDPGSSSMYAVVNVTSTSATGYASITVLPTGAPTIVNGQISIKRIT